MNQTNTQISGGIDKGRRTGRIRQELAQVVIKPLGFIKLWWLEAVRFLKAQFSTGVATALDWGALTLLLAVNVNYIIAVAVGSVLGAVTDFSMKKWWAFDAAGGMLRSQGIRYAIVSTLSALLNCAMAYILVEWVEIAKLPAVILASLVIGIAWNYPLHRLYVFSDAVGKSK